MSTINMLTYPDAPEIESFIREELAPFSKSGCRYELSVKKGDYKGYAVIIDLFKGSTKSETIYYAHPLYNLQYITNLKERIKAFY